MIIRTLALLALLRVVLCEPSPVFKLIDLNELPELSEAAESGAERQLSALRSPSPPHAAAEVHEPSSAMARPTHQGEASSSRPANRPRGRPKANVDGALTSAKMRRDPSRWGKPYTGDEWEKLSQKEKDEVIRVRKGVAAFRERLQQGPNLDRDEVTVTHGPVTGPSNAAFRELRRQARMWRRRQEAKAKDKEETTVSQGTEAGPKAAPELPDRYVFKEEYRDAAHPDVLRLADLFFRRQATQKRWTERHKLNDPSSGPSQPQS